MPPQAHAVTLDNVDLPATKDHPEEQQGGSVLMLDGFSYPLYKKLRAIDYDFYRGVHGKEGINRWCRVIDSVDEQVRALKETAAVLKECGWDYSEAVGDANDWEDDEA